MGRLRGFQCYYSKSKDRDPSQHACWSGIRSLKQGSVIKITRFDECFDMKYVHGVVELINQITPCFVEEDEGGELFLYYTVVGKYTKDLYLLNFVRYLWHSDNQFNNKNFFEIITKEKLDALDYTDPLEMLSCGARKSMKEGLYYSGDHSGLYTSNRDYSFPVDKRPQPTNNTMIRDVDSFNAWDGMTAMSYFAQGKEVNLNF